ncbi:hypothetical protein Rhow_001773 [Rhodococcus wratislaviensis]|uniref:Uncharacterized protein n=1 Tax=Rhodococcus wratislaviensis TaxID=44752 RepID=A0A402BYG6_RHOWR|nr:hypothetical protein Rhow_001773 [Rhodococcus wratislaviensis]
MVGVCVLVLTALGCLLFAIPLLVPDLLERILETGDVSLTQALFLSAATILVSGLLARALAAASFGRGRMVAASIGLSVYGVTTVMGGVIALLVTPELLAYALGCAGGACLGFCAVVTSILLDERRVVFGPPRLSLMREIISFGVKGQALGAADIVIFQSGKVIAGLVAGPAAAGVYELGSRLALGAQAFGSAASVALTTHLTRSFADGGVAEILPEYPRLTQRNAAVGIFLPFLLAATAFSAVPLWLGESNVAIVAVVMALSVALAVNVSSGVCTAAMLAIGRAGILALTSIADASLYLCVAIPLSLAFGFAGVVVATAGWITSATILGVWFLQSRVGIRMIDYIRSVLGPFATALVALFVALPVGIFSAPHDRASALLPFVLGAVTFSGVYLALGWRLHYLPRVKRQAPRTLVDEHVPGDEIA